MTTKNTFKQTLLLSVGLLVGSSSALAAEPIPTVPKTTSKYDSQLRSCIQDKLGSKDRNGYPAADYRAEVPGSSIVVDPSKVEYKEMDVDMWTSIDGFSWGTYRSTPGDLKAGSAILEKARAEKRMVKLTKLDHKKSQGPFAKYDQAIQIEITDRPIPANSDPVEAMYNSCEKVGSEDPNTLVRTAMRSPAVENPQENSRIAKQVGAPSSAGASTANGSSGVASQ